MAIISDNQINAFIDKLINFVEGLPMAENGKAYIRAKILIDFLDTWQFDDEANSFTLEEYLANPSNQSFTEVQSTYGIRNTTQIERWLHGFKTALKKARATALDKHLKELDKIHPAFKAARLSKSLAAITRAELFSNHGIAEIKDPEWNTQLKEILVSEINFSKEQAEILTKAPNPHQQKKANDDEILIVEELENRLAIEAVDYKHKIDELWETHKFDPTYFDSFISGPLLNEFSKSVYERIKPLNNQVINQYLSLCLQQFKTHTPPKRHKAFLLNYHDTYWFPNEMEYKENENDAKYATHVWKHYTNHFHLFKDAFQKIYDDFKIVYLGTPIAAAPFKSKPLALSFKYKNLISGSVNLTDLMNSLKRSALIHQDTSLANFRSVFSEKDIEQKIIWTGNISELAHFIKTLHNTAKKVEDTKQKQWDITINCFEMANGTVLTNQKLKQQQTPSSAAIIEKAVNIL